VTVVGAGCAGPATPPRLVAAGSPQIGTTTALELVDAPASVPALYAFALGSTLPAPLPLFGCDVWLDLTGGVATAFAITSASGVATLPMSIPPDPAFSGVQLAVQAGALGTALQLSNALGLAVQ
jgi:hypothetical protein